MIESKPISVDGDTKFLKLAKDMGWTGNGTKNNPIIISNLKIVAPKPSTDKLIEYAKSIGIMISNTDLYFIIENCIIELPHFSCSGIHINDVKHAIIRNNTIFAPNNQYGNKGIIAYCDRSMIYSNSIYSTTIAIEVSGNANLVFNNLICGIKYVTSDGINIMLGLANIVAHNVITVAKTSFTIFHGNMNIITNNLILDNISNSTFNMGNSENNNIMHNMIINEPHTDISFLDKSKNNFIYSNYMFSTDKDVPFDNIWVYNPNCEHNAYIRNLVPANRLYKLADKYIFTIKNKPYWL